MKENPKKTWFYIADDKGQGMVEYSLLLGFIALVVIVTLALVGPAVAQRFIEIVNAL